MPEPIVQSSSSSSANRWGGSDRHMVAALVLVALVVQALAWVGIQRLRGDATAYAFQSPDALEYVALGRGLAWQGRYVQLDSAGHPLSGPDTWRTPGYPLFLALIIRLGGDSPRVLLVAQQMLAVATVPLLWLVLCRLARPRWALLAVLAWCCDPFRLYYSFWLMSETLFTFVLLVACLVWVGKGRGARGEGRGTRDGGTEGQGDGGIEGATRRQGDKGTRGQVSAPSIRNSLAFILGLLAGLLVLIRPIALPLPLLVLAGIALAGWRGSWRKWLTLNLLCLLGISLTLCPWLLRNRLVAGHFALSQQSGASLAYHKVVDVTLWSEGRPEYRFDTEGAVAEIRERIDVRLRHEWPERYHPLSKEQLETLTWRNLNFGKPVAVDPFDASSMLWSIGLDMLAGRLWAMVKCFTVQGLFMLIFPLGLILWPPAGSGGAPLSMLLGGRGGLAATVIPGLIGAVYAALAGWILVRVIFAMVRGRWPAGFFALWPALAMFAFSLPSEDPRFRLPLIPLFWILAVAQSPSPELKTGN